MSNAMNIWNNEEHRNLMSLADAQSEFLRLYADRLPERDRPDFQRDLMYLIHLTYREAQTPLTKQLTDFVMTNTRPFVMDKKL